MQRDIPNLTDTRFDVLIIGGGAFGAAAARDAALRGLSVALIERADFGGGASANCFKMVHGGIRYLQHADIRRLRFSCAERTAWLRTAPHLVSPLPIAIPTYGRGRQGKLPLQAGMFLYDQLTRDRNRNVADESRRIRDGRFLSRSEVLKLFPEIGRPSLTGAAVFEDAQMYSPARLVLALVTAAVAKGAVACNYVEAVALLHDEQAQGKTVCGARVRDTLSGAEYEVHARLTLNAAGPWAPGLLPAAPGFPPPFSRDACLTLNRPASALGLALPGQTRDRDAVLGRSTRHLFMVPWNGKTLLGVWHRIHEGHPDTARVEEEELSQWIDEINAACPALDLGMDDVTYVNCGLLPFGEARTGAELSFGKQSHILDHRAQGLTGIVTIIGNRFTTACGDARQALDTLLEQLPVAPKALDIAGVPLTGGGIADFFAFRRELLDVWSHRLPEAALEALVRNHGDRAPALLAAAARGPHQEGLDVVPGSHTLVAEIGHAVAHEAAVRLEDVVLRRTHLGVGQHPGRTALTFVANHMAPLLKWSADETRAQVELCDVVLRKHLAQGGLTGNTADIALPEEKIA